jgi:hypothetical protein
MTKTARKAAVPLVWALIWMMMETGRASANDQQIAGTDQPEATIVLHLANYAALSGEVLDGAKAHVAKVYQSIGIHIAWVDGEEPVGLYQNARLNLTVLMLSGDMAEKKISAGRIPGHVLGTANISTGRAYVFCDRIGTVPGRTINTSQLMTPNLFSVAVGNIIAHEVGHLLLRTRSHSRNGIMRAHVDGRQPIHLRSFDETQARAIVNRLIEVASSSSER